MLNFLNFRFEWFRVSEYMFPEGFCYVFQGSVLAMRVLTGPAPAPLFSAEQVASTVPVGGVALPERAQDVDPASLDTLY